MTGTDYFFIVWSPQGEAPPRVVHDTEHDAEAEASRLAAASPGRTFYVLKAITRVHKTTVSVTKLTTAPIPF